MIEYDYELFEDEKDEIKKYTPKKISKRLSNLFYIEGPNSIGKSTLLYLIALGFYGLKNNKLPESVKYKIERLFSSDKTKVKFDIEVSDPNQELKLISKKPDINKKDIDVYEINGKEKTFLSSEAFSKKYRLICDVPDNPTNRLKELTEEIKETQNEYGANVGQLKEYIQKVLHDIEKSKDPNKIGKLKRELESFKVQHEKMKKTHKVRSEILSELKKSFYTNFYYEYKSKISSLQDTINELNNKVEKVKGVKYRETAKNKKLIGESKYMEYEIEKHQDILLSRLSNLKLKKSEISLDIFKKIHIGDCIENRKFPNEYELVIHRLTRLLEDTEEEEATKEDTLRINLYRELITLLKNYRDNVQELPGIKKPIKELITDLESYVIDHNENEVYVQNIKTALGELSQITVLKEKLERDYFTELKKMDNEKSKNSLEEEDSSFGELNLNTKKMEELKEKYEFFDREYGKLGKPSLIKTCKLGYGILEKYGSYGEEQLMEEITKLEEVLSTQESDLERAKYNVERTVEQIKDLENRKAHKYQEHKSRLLKLLTVCAVLDGKLRRNFSDYIKRIRDRVKETNDRKEKEYREAVFKYLGKKIGFVRHVEKEYEVESIDFINQTVKTTSKKEISLLSLGTGQGQSAYLRGVLRNAEAADNRTLIVLFDEIAMMDENSLKPVIDDMVDLRNKKRLLLGIIVQKGKEVKVVDLEKNASKK